MHYLSLFGTEYHVAKTGDDQQSGAADAPLTTIQAAAYRAMPGDVIIVHEGIYRERIIPLQGGKSDIQRITYQAAPGEKAGIKGSEVINNWVQTKGMVLITVIPNIFLGIITHTTFYWKVTGLIRRESAIIRGRCF